MQKKNTILETVIAGCKQGNEQAQHQLYKELYSYGMGICMRYAEKKEEANEMLNDGFYKIFTKLNQYDEELPFRPWFKVVIVNAAIDYHRRKKEFKSDDFENTKTELVDNFNIEDQLVYEDLIKVVQQLPPAYRTIFNMYVVEGYKHHEIADKLDISVGTSKSNLSKAKKKLRVLIEKIHQTKKN